VRGSAGPTFPSTANDPEDGKESIKSFAMLERSPRRKTSLDTGKEKFQMGGAARSAVGEAREDIRVKEHKKGIAKRGKGFVSSPIWARQEKP